MGKKVFSESTKHGTKRLCLEFYAFLLTLASYSINKIYFSTMLSVNGNAKSLGGPIKKSRLAERLQFIRNFVVFLLTSSKIELRKF